jgi:hypothetical protein
MRTPFASSGTIFLKTATAGDIKGVSDASYDVLRIFKILCVDIGFDDAGCRT